MLALKLDSKERIEQLYYCVNSDEEMSEGEESEEDVKQNGNQDSSDEEDDDNPILSKVNFSFIFTPFSSNPVQGLFL